MKKNVIMSLLGFILFSCSNEKSDSQNQPIENKTNLVLGLKSDANLGEVFRTLNNLDLKISQIDGFTFQVNKSRNDVNDLINTLNQKPYIKKGDFKATTSNVYFDASINKVKILTKFFDLNSQNQADFLSLISSLNLIDLKNDSKQIALIVPVGKEVFLKNEILKNSNFQISQVSNQGCFVTKQAKVLSANFPTSVAASQNVVVQIQYEVHNGCGSFGNYDELISQNNRKIKLNARYNTCLVCTEGFQTLTVNYNFNSNKVGLNTVEFIQPDGTLLTYSINVQPSNNNCFTTEHTTVISANFPSTVNVNENVTVPVIFQAHNSCVSFDNFETVNLGNTRNVKLITTYDSCIFCAQVVENKTIYFNFQIATTGVQEFKFMQPDGSFLNYSVTVQ